MSSRALGFQVALKPCRRLFGVSGELESPLRTKIHLNGGGSHESLPKCAIRVRWFRLARGIFIFATLDGTISGWNPAVDGGTGLSHATIPTGGDRSSVGAVYTGLAIAVNTSGKAFLYAADDGPNSRVDMFDGTFTFVQSFSDPGIPKGFAPYGIQTVNGQIWVTFTALDK